MASRASMRSMPRHGFVGHEWLRGCALWVTGIIRLTEVGKLSRGADGGIAPRSRAEPVGHRLGAARVRLSLWLLSIRLRDASIIDIFWGPAFGIVALVGYALGEHGVEVRRTLITVLTVLWAARLGIYLYWRNHGKGEDPRYTAAYRNRFPQPALAHADQGIPAAGNPRLADLDPGPARAVSRAAARGPAAIAGTGLWTIGFLFEAIADWQLARSRPIRESRPRAR